MEEVNSRTPLLGDKDSAQRDGESPLTDTLKRSLRKKIIILTLMCFLGFFGFGNSMAIYGPTLQDLVRITQTDLGTYATALVTRSACALVGAFLVGVLLKRFDPWYQLAVAMLFIGAVSIIVPLIHNISIIYVLFAVLGTAGGFYDSGGNVVVLAIWQEENGPWMQALHCLYGVGALTGPLIAGPFLSSTHLDTAPTAPPSNVSMVTRDVMTQGNVTSPSSDVVTRGDTAIQWVYLIVGLLCSVPAVLIAVSGYFCGIGKVFPKDNDDKKSGGDADIQQARDEKVFRVSLITIVFCFYVSYCALEIGVATYLASFALYLGWSKSDGALVTSVFWAAFSVGRAAGIPLINCVPINVFLLVNTAVAVAAMIPVMLFATLHPAVLWVCMAFLGAGISTTYATGITWFERYIEVTPAIGTVFMVASAGGDMVATLVIGSLFDVTGARIFGYTIFAVACLMAVLLCTMVILGYRHGHRKRAA